MNISNEIKKVQEKIKLPVSSISLSAAYVEIFSDKISIGTLPITRTPGDIIIYDTDERNLLRLNWNIVYERYREKFRELIMREMKNSAIEMTPATFRKIYLKDSSKKIIGFFECYFEDGEWRCAPSVFS